MQLSFTVSDGLNVKFIIQNVPYPHKWQFSILFILKTWLML
jgi:hypothetical protein